jgi:hypothetical protein
MHLEQNVVVLQLHKKKCKLTWDKGTSNYIFVTEAKKKPLHIYVTKSSQFDCMHEPHINTTIDESSGMHCLCSIHMQISPCHRSKSCAGATVNGVRKCCHEMKAEYLNFHIIISNKIVQIFVSQIILHTYRTP